MLAAVVLDCIFIVMMKIFITLKHILFVFLPTNYTLGLLDDNKPLVSFMDMGGASVQVATPLAENTVVDPMDTVNITVQGRAMRIFIHSFLGLGQTEATHQFLDDPSCYPTGYVLPSGQIASGDASTCSQHVESLINSVHQVYATLAPVFADQLPKTWY